MSDVQDSVDSLIDCIVKRYDHDRIIRGSMIVIAGLLPFIMIFITSILISEKYAKPITSVCSKAHSP
jgi:hypothetical protein